MTPPERAQYRAELEAIFMDPLEQLAARLGIKPWSQWREDRRRSLEVQLRAEMRYALTVYRPEDYLRAIISGVIA